MKHSKLTVFVCIALIAAAGCERQDDGRASASGTSSEGFMLVQKFGTTVTDLIDMKGRTVHQWESQYRLKGGSHLLENGDFLKSGFIGQNAFYRDCPGLTGVVERMDWDGRLLWSCTLAEEFRALHHDIEPLPNGNILMLVMNAKSPEDQMVRGRDPARIKAEDLWIDSIIEVKPAGPKGGEIVWEWRIWDHMIQDFDPSKKNHGVVADHPERVDINFIENPVPLTPAAMRQMQSIGYVSGGGERTGPQQGMRAPDWTHLNAIRYNAALDQILISVRSLHELWIIDHSTTTAEAATDKGGRQGKGGGILYRWGNPQAYHRGGPSDQKLFVQHDAQWIKAGLPGAGNILVFNNGEGRKDGAYSSVEELTPPVTPAGSYDIVEGQSYGPADSSWRYVSDPKDAFYSRFLSGAQRLSNGNTLICDGMKGHVFEVDSFGATKWEWASGMPEGLSGGKSGPAPVPSGIASGNRLPGPDMNRDTKAMFRAVRYDADHPAFAGKNLQPN